MLKAYQHEQYALLGISTICFQRNCLISRIMQQTLASYQLLELTTNIVIVVTNASLTYDVNCTITEDART
eukprot:scaffold227834_cov50-Cyclotella_meneghiniana.AAC.1